MAKATPTADNTEAAAEWVEIDALREWKDNPRKNDGEPVRKVVESIKRFGFGAPIIARKANGEIIAGHTRFKAAKELGLHRVPVRFLDLDPADAHLLALADNRLNEEAAWDSEKLAAILSLMQAEGVEVEASGFGEAELQGILRSAEVGGLDDATPPDEFKAYDETIETNTTCPKCGYEWSAPKT